MSDYLFATPSFFSGVARTLDLGATFDDYNDSAKPAIADNIAVFLDLRAVGNDLAIGLDQLAEESARDRKGSPARA